MNIWVVSILWLSWIMLLWVVISKLLVIITIYFHFPNVYPWERNCCIMLALYLIFWRIVRLFSQAAQFFYHASNVWTLDFKSLHILTNTCYFFFLVYFSHARRYEMVLLWFLLASSLIANGVDHLFMCLLALCKSWLEKHIFKFFDHLKIVLFVFLLLSDISC